jgi:hypothetical protein
VVVLEGFVASPAGATEPNLRAAVVPLKAALARRPHSQADTAEVELRGAALPFDPRVVEGLGLRVYMANAAREGEDIQREENLRFLGTIDLFENEQDETDVVSLKARDLSGALRDTKPLPAAYAPRYSDTLHAAILRITGGVLGAGVLEVVGEDVPLSSLVDSRSSASPVRLPNDATAWGVVEYLCSLCGLLVQVRLDRVEVLQARAAYSHSREPRAVLEFNSPSANVLKLKTGKKFVRNRKGIKVVAFDTTTRRRVEAVYPPDSELPPRHQGTPSRGRRRRARPQPPERDVFTVAGVTQAEQLTNVARSIWLERSRQEAEVECETPFFMEPFLSLANGDRVSLQLNRALAAGLNLSQPRAEQVRWVRLRLGVEAPVASLLVDAARNPGSDVFYVHIADLRWEAESLSAVKLELINLFGVTV